MGSLLSSMLETSSNLYGLTGWTVVALSKFDDTTSGRGNSDFMINFALASSFPSPE